MSAVIKPGGAGRAHLVTPYAADLAAQAADAARPDPQQEELERLRALLTARDATLEQAKKDVAKARAEGEAAGRKSAELAAKDSRDQALALLRRGIEQAQAALTAGREQMEVLALLIARTALDKLFGDDPRRKDAVAALVIRQLRAIDQQMLLAIEVSRVDFPSDDELAALAAEVGIEPEMVSANADFPAGGCSMQLRIGMLEVGTDQQWGAIRDLLDGLAGAVETRP